MRPSDSSRLIGAVLTDEPRVCRTCRYCVPDGSLGWCHRFPPQWRGGDLHVDADFPSVRLTAWCGEYLFGKGDRSDAPSSS